MEVILDKNISILPHANEVEVLPNNTLSVSIIKKEYKIVGDDVYITKKYQDAPQWMLDTIQLGIDINYDEKIGEINDLITSLNDLIVELDVAKNTYEQSIISSAEIDERINAAIITLNSSLSGVDATLIEQIATKVTATEAEAISNQILQASINGGDIGALINNLRTAVTDGDEVNAQDILLLNAKITDPDTGLDANANAVTTLNANVGIDDAGTPTGTGLIKDVDDLRSQVDGVVETWFQDPSPIDPVTQAPVPTQVPYMTWFDLDTTNGNEEERNKHTGDTYAEFDIDPMGDRILINSYRFARVTPPDSTTDANGFAWILISDNSAAEALQKALEAQQTADGKITTFYWYSKSPTGVSGGTQPIGTYSPVAEGDGDLWFDGDDDDKTYRWDKANTTWVDARDKKIEANASAITDLNAYAKDPNTGVIGGADSQLIQDVDVKVEDGVATATSKFAYNSILEINGQYYKSGFGLDSTVQSGIGTETDPFIANFWIDATKFEFTNSASTGSVSPFTIDASGSIPSISFNGTVSFTNVTDKDDVIERGDDISELNNNSGFTDDTTANKAVNDAANAQTTADSKITDVEAGILIETNKDTNNDQIATRLGYADYQDMIDKATLGQTIIDGGFINAVLIKANSIVADMINTNGLIAENISANEIVGKKIIGSQITGAVIKASYLDLDGEIEVLTNFHLSINDYNLDPSLWTDAVLITADNEYRIPSLSTVREESLSSTLVVGSTLKSKIRAYNCGNAGHNIRAVKVDPRIAVTLDTPIIKYNISGRASSGNMSGSGTMSYTVKCAGNPFTITTSGSSCLIQNTSDDGSNGYTMRTGTLQVDGITVVSGMEINANVQSGGNHPPDTSTSSSGVFTRNGITYRIDASLGRTQYGVFGNQLNFSITLSIVQDQLGYSLNLDFTGNDSLFEVTANDNISQGSWNYISYNSRLVSYDSSININNFL